MSDVLEPDELQAIEAELMEDGEGFSENSANNKQEQNKYKSILNAKAISKLFKSVFSTAARMSGNNALNLLPDELDELGEAMQPVAEKYLPDMLDKYGAEFAASLAVCGVGMRIWRDSDKQEENKNG